MATLAIAQEDFVSAVASEMCAGIEAAVDCWMAQIEEALRNPNLTTLGKVHAIKEVLEIYKQLTGKEQLRRRRAS